MNDYSVYKNKVAANISTLNLNEEQINFILTSMDRAADGFSFYEKTSVADFQRGMNGVPHIVYQYIECKQGEGLAIATTYGYRIVLEMFFKWCTKDIPEIISDDIRAFLKYYQKSIN